MSWWTNVRDTAELVGTLGMYDPKKSRQMENDQRNLVQGQIKAYQEQTALTRQQLDSARDATMAEKRRVEEKQIRSLRQSNRAQNLGLLGVGAPGTSDMTTNLGG